jgi:hypothetical protein
MSFGFSGFTASNDGEATRHKNQVRSWSVYVLDTSRHTSPRAWPVAGFRQENDARVVWENLKTKYADARNLHFYMEPSDGEPRGVIQYFERKFGTCPLSLRVEVPQANLKASAGS